MINVLKLFWNHGNSWILHFYPTPWEKTWKFFIALRGSRLDLVSFRGPWKSWKLRVEFLPHVMLVWGYVNGQHDFFWHHLFLDPWVLLARQGVPGFQFWTSKVGAEATRADIGTWCFPDGWNLCKKSFWRAINEEMTPPKKTPYFLLRTDLEPICFLNSGLRDRPSNVHTLFGCHTKQSKATKTTGISFVEQFNIGGLDLY